MVLWYWLLDDIDIVVIKYRCSCHFMC